jgi:hypothetical protein
MVQLSQDLKPTLLYFNESELMHEEIRNDINSLMAHNELLSLFNADDRDQIVSSMCVQL